jgi:hypothetical protein
MRNFDKFHFLSIFANFSNIYEIKITFFKKLVEVAPATYLKFDVSESTCSGVSEISNVIVALQGCVIVSLQGCVIDT